MSKTAGNPFFVNQFLRNLYAENLITFNLKNHQWQWDINKIQEKNITDNVVELMTNRLKKLPTSTQHVLQLAACIGANFNLSTLSIVCEKPEHVIFSNLVTAVQSELIVPLSELNPDLLVHEYKFLHDRVQQAAYALIDDCHKKEIHLQIGRLIWQSTDSETLSENIFEIVDHLNQGILNTGENISEKMAALGQLIAGIAHEINTPLGAIRSSAGNISKFLRQTLEQLPTLFESLTSEEGQDFIKMLQRSLQNESNLTAKEERKRRRVLIRQLETEDIQDADTIADTLVDMGIYNNIEEFLPLLKRPHSSHLLETAYKLSGLQRGTQTINIATERASKVVFALKNYARYNQSGTMILANLTADIETVLTLYQNQLKHGIKVSRNYEELPPILCYADELNQVWTNLIHNALQAMDNQGTLTIDVKGQDQQIKVSITDSGKGIPPEIRSKIFQPFFTTKLAGEGSGLGLDIVKKIIEKHQGQIDVESIPGKTTFIVSLPFRTAGD